MNKYIIIQKNKLKIELLSAISEYSIRARSRTVKFDIFFESLCAYEILSKDDLSDISRTLSDMGPDEVDEFVGIFINDHPAEYVDDYTYSAIPLIATESQPLELRCSMFKGPVQISLEREKQILDFLKNPYNMCDKQNIVEWFDNFCYQYGIQARLKRDIGEEAEALAEVFCQVHGFDIDTIEWDGSGAKVPVCVRLKNITFVWTIILLYLFIVAAFLSAAYNSDTFWAGGLCAVIGFTMIAVPMYNIFTHK